MGVDFYLCHIKRKRLPKSDIALPEIEARFRVGLPVESQRLHGASCRSEDGVSKLVAIGSDRGSQR